MNSNFVWSQHFPVPEADIQTWHNEASEKKSLLLWCMEKGTIEPHEFLNWARDNYRVPSVGTQFFNTNKNTSFWAKIKDQAAWSEEIVPISEWDGVLYVACLEP